MKTVDIQQTNLDACVNESQSERILITRGGTPVALVVSVQGLDEEQIELGSSDEFWKLVAQRRKEETISRTAMESRLQRRGPRRGSA